MSLSLFFHGGSRRQMLLGFHYLFYYHGTYAMNQWLASLGYVVLSVNYRSGIGYGMEFREALDYGATGASERCAESAHRLCVVKLLGCDCRKTVWLHRVLDQSPECAGRPPRPAARLHRQVTR